MATPDVRVRLSAEGISEVVSALRKVATESRSSGSAAAEGFAPLSKALEGIRGLAAAIGVSIGAAELLRFGRDAVEAAIGIQEFGEKIGTTTREASALALAARLSGIGLEKLASLSAPLAKQIDELKNGSASAANAFARLGLTARDFAGDNMGQHLDTVARALGKLETGASRTAAAYALLGRRSGDLLQMGQQLERLGGLAGADARARALGLSIDDRMIATLQALKSSLVELQIQAQGLAAQFIAGFGPHMVETLNTFFRTVDPAGVTAMRHLGDETGSAFDKMGYHFERAARQFEFLWDNFGALLKFVRDALAKGSAFGGAAALQFSVEVNALYAQLRQQEEDLDRKFKGLPDRVRGTGFEQELAANDRARAQGTVSLEQYFVERKRIVETHAEEERQIVLKQLHEVENNEKLSDGQRLAQKRELLRKVAQIDAEVARMLAEPAPPAGGRVGPPGAAGTDRAAARQREADAEARLLQQRLRNEEEADKAAYDRGDLALERYLERRRERLAESFGGELVAIQRERDAVAGDKSLPTDDRAAKLKELDLKTELAIAKAKGEGLRLDTDDAQLREKLQKDLEESARKQMSGEDERHQKVLDNIIAEQHQRELALRQSGTPAKEAHAIAQADADRAIALERVAHQQALIAAALQDYRDERDRIEGDVVSGQLTQREGALQLLDLDRQRLAPLRAAAQLMLAMGLYLKDPETIAAAERLNAAIAKVETKARTLKDDLRSGVQGELASFFGSQINQVRSLTDAVVQLTLAIARAVQQALALRLAESITTAIFGPAPGHAAGGQVQRRAAGGVVTGPGGPESDTVPAWLSPGEYVVRASAVRQPGVLTMLEGINGHQRLYEAFRDPMVMKGIQMSAPGYVSSRLERFQAQRSAETLQLAQGGIAAVQNATARASAELGAKFTFELPPGLGVKESDLPPGATLREIQTSEGRRVLIEWMSDNRRAITGALHG